MGMRSYWETLFEIWENGERCMDAQIACVSDTLPDDPEGWATAGPTLTEIKAGFAERDELRARIDKALEAIRTERHPDPGSPWEAMDEFVGYFEQKLRAILEGENNGR